MGVRTGARHVDAEGGGGANFSRAHLSSRSCSSSSAGAVVEFPSSRSWLCSRSTEKDCLLRSFFWLVVSL